VGYKQERMLHANHLPRIQKKKKRFFLKDLLQNMEGMDLLEPQVDGIISKYRSDRLIAKM
jgi:hypothetical protein